MAAWNVPAHGFPNSTSPGLFSFFSMLDPKLIRETPELVRAALAKKHLSVDLDAVLAVDAAWRTLLQEVELLRSTQKAANTAMAALPKGSPEFIAKVQEMKAVSSPVKE